MPVEFEPFDVVDYLDSEERIAGYLSAAAEDDDPNVLLLALSDAAKARGMMQVARAAGLSRESLYKALRPGSHLRYETVQAVMRALGVKFTVAPRAVGSTISLGSAPDHVFSDAPAFSEKMRDVSQMGPVIMTGRYPAGATEGQDDRPEPEPQPKGRRARSGGPRRSPP
jgi:probable addiction module antidote protein